MDKDQIVRAWCAQRVGCPYIYGGTGKPCTPSYRKARMAQYPAYGEKIKRNCGVLSGSLKYCSGCKWADPETGIGKLAYDCAQLSRWAMAEVGISLVSGANSQWERTRWETCGTIGLLPRDKVCLVFRWDDDKGKMGHVGIYQGNGTVVHAKGHDYGVVRQRIEDVKFTHWGIPMGLYTEVSPVNHPTLRLGDDGAAVKEMQRDLALLDYMYADAVDGIFGPITEDAVRRFQRENGLTVDGVCGPKTWAALDAETGHDEDAQPDDPSPEPAPEPDGTIAISKSDWNALRASVSILHQIVKKYENEG